MTHLIIQRENGNTIVTYKVAEVDNPEITARNLINDYIWKVDPPHSIKIQDSEKTQTILFKDLLK